MGMPRILAWPAAFLPVLEKQVPHSRTSLRRLLELPGKFRLDVNRRLQLLKGVDHLIVQVNWARDALIRNGVSPERISVSPPCVYRGFSYVADQQETQKPQNRPLLLGFLGRLKPYKGADLLISAVKTLPAELPIEVHIHGIIRSDDDRREYQRLVALAHGDPRLRFLPALSDSEVQAEVSQWDVLVCPSRVQDMRPQVILEALALKVPVIGARCGGIPELIQDGRTGLLFEPCSVEDLSRALRIIVSEPALMQRLRAGIQPVPGPEIFGSFMLRVIQLVVARSERI